jgi:uncharacterized protein HemX
MCVAAAAVPAVSLAISGVSAAAGIGFGLYSAQQQAATNGNRLSRASASSNSNSNNVLKCHQATRTTKSFTNSAIKSRPGKSQPASTAS